MPVTNQKHDVCSLGHLCRDRTDAENAFDELKNQWDWGGFTTHDLHLYQLRQRLLAGRNGLSGLYFRLKLINLGILPWHDVPATI
ncbi:MAG: hypothetical protein A3G25_05300 [Betaproteobacteria bacterium RIFCSPLOWO2_12_FULL_63_13]|nr:MAG: hypothetical protein A3G25_05300 [Betaproteobacteria bacterium RIFCSPLOWO2_12_FULL_63_13]